jgi:hypothetical protein
MIRLWFAGLNCLFLATVSGGTICVSPAPDEGDSGPVIREAIARALEQGPGATVRLGKGIFRIRSAADDNWFFVIGGGRDLTIEGEGDKTQVVFTDPGRGGFLVAGGQGVSIRGLSIDYDPVPFIQGTVVSVNPTGNEFDLELDPGFPSPNEPWFATGNPVSNMGVLFDSERPRLKAGAPDYLFISGWQNRSGNRWAIHLGEPGGIGALAEGDRFVLLSRRGNGAFLFAGTTNCLLENVIVRASPSLTVSLTGSDRMTIRGLKIACAEGSPRLIASNGDGIHCQQNRKGPLIEDCFIEGLCDDGVNIYTVPLVVRQVISSTQVVLAGGSQVREGDELQVFDPQRGIIRGQPRATAVREGNGNQIVTLDRPVEGMVAGNDHRSADTIFNLSASGAGYVIRNNHFRNHRRFGLNLRGGDGLVEGNTFEELGGWSASVGNEPSWPEGPAPCNVVIRGNHIIGGGYSGGYGDGKGGPGIRVCGLSLNGLAVPPLIRGIVIENNRFTRPSDPAIEVRSARDVLIVNNRSTADPGSAVRTSSEMSEDVKVDPK